MRLAREFDGPPKSLAEAIKRAAETSYGRTWLSQFQTIISDYLAEQFCETIEKNPVHRRMLEKLFEDCVGGQNVKR
jgi:hypothetical protein